MPGEASATERRAEEWRSSNLAKLFPIDVTKYSLKGEELEFMQTQTGIKDEEELKKHILAVQAEAYSVSMDLILGMAHTREILTRLTGFSVPMHPSLCILGVCTHCVMRSFHQGLITNRQPPPLAASGLAVCTATTNC